MAVTAALDAGRPSAEHVLNVLARLKQGSVAGERADAPALRLREEPRADVQRYDTLRSIQETQP